jgi:hypothetical protein
MRTCLPFMARDLPQCVDTVVIGALLLGSAVAGLYSLLDKAYK